MKEDDNAGKNDKLAKDHVKEDRENKESKKSDVDDLVDRVEKEKE